MKERAVFTPLVNAEILFTQSVNRKYRSHIYCEPDNAGHITCAQQKGMPAIHRTGVNDRHPFLASWTERRGRTGAHGARRELPRAGERIGERRSDIFVKNMKKMLYKEER